MSEAARVQAVIAAGLTRPELITRWMADPGELDRHGLAGRDLDLAAIAKFAGLGMKVRHNGLRAVLPCSFRLLKRARIEIELFAAYARHVSSGGAPLGATNLERARGLAGFFETWRDVRDPLHGLIGDSLQNEIAVLELRSAPPVPEEGAAPLGRGSVVASSILGVRGRLLLRELRFAPQVIAAASVDADDAPLPEAPAEPHLLGYWQAPACEDVELLELDALGWAVLTQLDGARSLDEVAHAVTGRPATDVFLGLVSPLVELGMASARRPGQPSP